MSEGGYLFFSINIYHLYILISYSTNKIRIRAVCSLFAYEYTTFSSSVSDRSVWLVSTYSP